MLDFAAEELADVVWDAWDDAATVGLEIDGGKVVNPD